MPTWTPKKPSKEDARRGLQRADFITLDRRERAPVFILWRNGARIPASYYRSLSAAQEAAQARVRPGEAICILRAEIVSTVASALPQITIETEPGGTTRAALRSLHQHPIVEEA